MERIEIFDTDEQLLGSVSNVTLQPSRDRHATGGGYLSGQLENAPALKHGHYRALKLKSNERTYQQCWVHSMTELDNVKQVVFSFTYTEGAPLPAPAATGGH